MDTFIACMMGMANRGKERMVFDWDKAVDIINEKGIKSAGAGLEGDLGYTGGEILEDGKPVTDSYCYLASTWARPVLVVYDEKWWEDGPKEIPCYIMESKTTWNEKTIWPESALRKLGLPREEYDV